MNRRTDFNKEQRWIRRSCEKVKGGAIVGKGGQKEGEMFNSFFHRVIKYIWALERGEITLTLAQWIYWDRSRSHTFLSVCVCVHTHEYARRHAHTSPLTLTHFLGRRINYYSVCRSLRLIPPVMDVTLCGAAKCVLEMCLELLCGTAECFWNEIITGWEPL